MARAEIIIDSSVLIDLLLSYSKALEWSASLDYRRSAITSITTMEILSGASNKQEMSTLGRFLSRFQELEVLRQDSKWAVRQFREFWLSHKIGINDCLIAAIAARTGLPVYTLNIKDFEPLPDIKVVKPY